MSPWDSNPMRPSYRPSHVANLIGGLALLVVVILSVFNEQITGWLAGR